MKYIVCRGCPASGKTTWAKKYRSKNGVVRANRDDTRRELFDFGQWSEYKFTGQKEARVTEVLDAHIQRAYDNGFDVIDDNTNLTRFNTTIRKAEEIGFDVHVKDFFDVHLHQLIDRNIAREYSVPEHVIHKMFKDQMKLQDRDIKPQGKSKSCIIVDIDGTVADMGKGTDWGRSPYQWDRVMNDRPRENVVNVVRQLGISGKNIVFLTGRDGVSYNDTKEWLERHVVNLGDEATLFYELYSRDADDMRADCIVKEELLKKYVLPTYDVEFCIEDRKQIYSHYRALGLECWSVSNGFF